MTLKKIISGGQNGADQAGLFVGKRFGLETGGWMPLGFKTLDGPRPEFAELYGVQEHASTNYPERTYQNISMSDGTVRFAADFNSRGEICTLRGLKSKQKPYFDVDLTDPPNTSEFVDWLCKHDIETLNVAGNAENTYLGAYRKSVGYLSNALFDLGFKVLIKPEEILKLLGFEKAYEVTCLGQKFENLEIKRIFS
jgi:hypothetical protein